MVLNHLKTAARSLRRNRLFSLLNIVGLAVGLASCLLMAGYVVHELSYDRMHVHRDRIWRVDGRVPFDKQVFLNAVVGAPLGPAAKETIPEIEECVRIRRLFQVSIRAGLKDFQERLILLAEPRIFDVFTIPLLRGDPRTALADPFTVVIDEAFARRCFGAEDPMGRTLRFGLNDAYDFRITGVMKNMPSNSVISRSVIGSYASMQRISPQETSKWDAWGATTTFVLLRPGARAESVGEKITALAKSHLSPEEGKGVSYFLQPLGRIYLDAGRLGMNNELAGAANPSQIAIFIIVALLILLIAVINFVNLSTAKVARRMKEVGVRKTCGAGRRHLILQFLTESILVVAASMILGLLFFELFRPRLDAFLGRQISLNLLSGPGLLLLTVGLVGVVGFLAGGYPALYLSRFPAAVVFRSGAASPVSKSGLRRALVVGQFFVAVVLIASTLVILKQIRYTETKDLGFNAHDLVLLRIRDAKLLKNADVLKKEIISRSRAEGAAAIAFLPSGQNRGISVYSLENAAGAKGVMAQGLSFDPDFIPTFGLKIIEGRNFEPEGVEGTDVVLVNETAVKAFGLADPVGRVIYRDGRALRIIGIVRDWHTNSLHSLIEPVVMTPSDQKASSLVVRLPRRDRQAVLARIREVWISLMPDQAFDPIFVDDYLNEAYQKEKRLAALLVSFCGLTVLVSCLGIFGLASYSAEQRTKEIGIRKVLGASVTEINVLLSMGYLRWVLAASVAAGPVAYLEGGKMVAGVA
jgi:putative ABC transport system permease protein